MYVKNETIKFEGRNSTQEYFYSIFSRLFYLLSYKIEKYKCQLASTLICVVKTLK